jgi:hypothetical protein
MDVLVLDRNNYHGFWPFLYQAATGILETHEIADPKLDRIIHLLSADSRTDRGRRAPTVGTRLEIGDEQVRVRRRSG